MPPSKMVAFEEFKKFWKIQKNALKKLLMKFTREKKIDKIKEGFKQKHEALKQKCNQ